ncbi:rod shape-determining protein [Nonomuraea sp. NPDC059194]|uniref:rod shape-determining protein n=1 Tax=Nonomuraea sp. NPDC059194 TaxID=3346764 RepID=UPI0036A4F0BA
MNGGMNAATALRERGGRSAALDLGTARIRMVGLTHPVIIDQPSRLTSAAGSRRPVRHGMVADTTACAQLVGTLLRSAFPETAHPWEQVLLGVPVTASPAQRTAAADAVTRATGCPVTLVEEPLAAAIGGGMDVTDPRPQLLIDVGAGIVEAVVIHQGTITDALAVQIAEAAQPGLPPHAQQRVVAMTAELLTRVPARLRASVRERGLLLTGGGAGHPRLASHLCSRLDLTVSTANDPAHATIRGLTRLCLSTDGSMPYGRPATSVSTQAKKEVHR